MKKLILFTAIFVLAIASSIAQVGINTDNSLPHNSAMLDVKSNIRGFLPPRMTQAERDAIVNPAEGLMIMCTNCGSPDPAVMSIFLNGAWRFFSLYSPTPATPLAGTHIPSTSQIIWNWNTATGAVGYKFNTVNNYSTAEEMGAAITKTETGLLPSTPYTRYVWAYNAYGISVPVILSSQTLTYVIGQSYGGGVIFYIDPANNMHGLISATFDLSFGSEWGCDGTFIGGTSTLVFAGQANTTTIVNGCSQGDIAASICNDLVLNGYGDWFLPSKDALSLMYSQKTAIGGFASENYWSSSEYNLYEAWTQNFANGDQYNSGKSNTYYVRAVRAF